jgi:peptidoglycan/xylan/chitin deacetylase (PgdA/CDA1 family)
MNIPVLLYHVVKPDPDPANNYQYPLDEFAKQMEYLHANGYTTLSADEYLDVLDGKAEAPAKPVLLTFDDNTADFTEYVMPVLEKYGMKAIQFTVSGWIDGDLHMSAREMVDIASRGIDVLNHTVTHPVLSEFDRDRQRQEIAEGGKALEALVGRRQDIFAYPYGRYNEVTIDVLRELGYRAAFIVANEKSGPETPRMELPRYCLLQFHTMDDFVHMVN